jgi:hypothetical protein
VTTGDVIQTRHEEATMLRLQLTVLGLMTLGLLVGAPSVRGHAADPPELLGNTTIVHACVSSGGGMVQVVDATAGQCQSGATSLHWALIGAPGPSGARSPGKVSNMAPSTCGPWAAPMPVPVDGGWAAACQSGPEGRK